MDAKKGTVVAEAESLYYSGRCDEAIGILKESFSSDPTRADILASLVQLLLDSERYESAMGFLDRFNSKSNHSLITIQRALCLEATGDLTSAEILADQLVESGQLRAEALALKARLMLRMGRKETAEALFRKAIESDNSCSRAWFGLASLKQNYEELTGIFDLLRQAFLCSPDSRGITVAFHACSVNGGYLLQAEEAFREGLKRRPMNRRLRFLLIDLLLRQHRIPEAMSEIEAALVDFGSDEGLLDAALKIRQQLSSFHFSSESGGGANVSLCMIVKNEKHHLAKCLKSAKPVVDEIIVVDTGSSDETKEIAHIFGARVFDFVWEDDFSMARNFSLSKATGEWILVLDADEVLSANDYEKFRGLVRSGCSRPAAFRIQTRNYSNLFNTIGFRQNQGEFPEEQGIGWYPSDKVRLFTNDPRIRFEYSVHELVEPSLEKMRVSIEDSSIAVHHYGKLREAQAQEKIKNYRELGRNKLRKNFKNAAAVKESAVQSAQLGNYNEALNLWRRFVRLRPHAAEGYLNIGAICWNLERYSEAISFSEKALQLDPHLKEAGFNLAFSMLMTGRAGEAKIILERPVLIKAGNPAAQLLLCVAYACLQENARAESVYEKLLTLPIGAFICESLFDIAKRFISASQSNYALRTIEAAKAFGCNQDQMMELLSCYNPA